MLVNNRTDAYFLSFNLYWLCQYETLRRFYVHLLIEYQFRYDWLTTTQGLYDQSERKWIVFVVDHGKIVAKQQKTIATTAIKVVQLIMATTGIFGVHNKVDWIWFGVVKPIELFLILLASFRNFGLLTVFWQRIWLLFFFFALLLFFWLIRKFLNNSLPLLLYIPLFDVVTATWLSWLHLFFLIELPIRLDGFIESCLIGSLENSLVLYFEFLTLVCIWCQIFFVCIVVFTAAAFSKDELPQLMYPTRILLMSDPIYRLFSWKILAFRLF